jgi:hypothetical protein
MGTGGGLGFVPGFLMGDDATPARAGLRESLRRLLDLEYQLKVLAMIREQLPIDDEAVAAWVASPWQATGSASP